MPLPISGYRQQHPSSREDQGPCRMVNVDPLEVSVRSTIWICLSTLQLERGLERPDEPLDGIRLSAYIYIFHVYVNVTASPPNHTEMWCARCLFAPAATKARANSRLHSNRATRRPSNCSTVAKRCLHNCLIGNLARVLRWRVNVAPLSFVCAITCPQYRYCKSSSQA